MALIRVTEEWLRSPAAAAPTRARSVMVVADTWAEQKVLMRAYASSQDQTRPAIVLNGAALAIGPSGSDPHGPWGIHVDHGSEGRAQELRDLLIAAARRLAGTKGTPPRLQDEVSDFDRRQTNLWSPGGARDRDSQGAATATAAEPVSAPPPATHVGQSNLAESPRRGLAPPPSSPPATAAPATQVGRAPVGGNPSGVVSSARRPKPGTLPPPGLVPRARRRPPTSPPKSAVYRSAPGARTVSPFGPHTPVGAPPPAAPAAQAPRRRKRPTGARYQRAITPVPVNAPLGQIVGRTMPLGFRLEPLERTVLNELGTRGCLTGRQIGEIVGEADGVAWMEALMRKLADHGLDVVEPGDDDRGEPTYVLRR